MNRIVAVTGAVLLLGGSAWAQNDTSNMPSGQGTEGQQPMHGARKKMEKTGSEAGMTSTTSKSPDEVKKHLTELELYTRTALDNSKAAYQSAELPQGPMDKTLLQESAANISRDLAKAEEHLSHLKKMNLPAMMKDKDKAARFGEIGSHLKMAQKANTKLESLPVTDRMTLQDQAATVYTQLSAAAEGVRETQGAFDAMTLDKITPPEKSPVRGTEPDMKDMKNQDMNMNKKDMKNMKQGPE